MIVEGFSSGLEVECSVIGNGEPVASVPGEIVLQGADWYDYEAKYSDGGMRLSGAGAATRHGARGGPPARRRHVRCASAAPGLARVDFFVEDGERVIVNELNTMPGFTDTSVFPKLWEASGLGFSALCDRLLVLARERYAAERGSHAY